MSFSGQPHNNNRSFGHSRPSTYQGSHPRPQHGRPGPRAPFQPPTRPVGPVTPVVPPRRKPLPEGLIEKLCYDNDVLKPKPDCRAALIDFCILEDDFDIDEAEDAVDKALRERNLWNEPRLEDILYGDEPDAAPSTDSPIPEIGNVSA